PLPLRSRPKIPPRPSSELFAIEKDPIYVLEGNPRASRTVPFVSKATGLPLAKVASLAMAGISFADQKVTRATRTRHYSVKEAVLDRKSTRLNSSHRTISYA